VKYTGRRTVVPLYIHLHLVSRMSSSCYFIIIIQKVVKIIHLMGELNVTINQKHSAQTINTSLVTKDEQQAI